MIRLRCLLFCCCPQVRLDEEGAWRRRTLRALLLHRQGLHLHICLILIDALSVLALLKSDGLLLFRHRLEVVLGGLKRRGRALRLTAFYGWDDFVFDDVRDLVFVMTSLSLQFQGVVQVAGGVVHSGDGLKLMRCFRSQPLSSLLLLDVLVDGRCHPLSLDDLLVFHVFRR